MPIARTVITGNRGNPNSDGYAEFGTQEDAILPIRVTSDGVISLGDGTSAHDVVIQRTAAGVLTITGTLSQTGVAFVVPLTTTDAVTVAVTGDTQKRFTVNGDGSIEWGSGALAPDTNLYRSAANSLQTDDSLTVLGNIGCGALFLLGADVILSRSAADTLQVANNLSVTKHVLTSGTAPTAAAGAQAGSSPPAPVVAATSNDVRGSLTWGTGTGPAAGAQAVVTFNAAYSAAIGAPFVMLTPSNAATANLDIYVTTVGTGAFTIATNGAPAASQANTIYGAHWHVIG